MRRLRATALVLVLFAATLVWRFPTRWVVARLPAGVQCEAEGTVWSGGCLTLSAAGVRLERVRWQVRAGDLLHARLAATVTVDDTRLSGSTELRADIHGTLTLPTVDLRLNLQSRPLPALPADLGGELAIHLTDVVWRDNALGDARGTIVAQQLRRLSRPLDYGSYELRLEGVRPGDSRLTGTLRDLGGPLAVGGVVRVDPHLAWEAEGTVATRPEADEELVKLVNLMGPADANGHHPFSVEGRP